ncbi:MAG: hypothetical protein PWP23_792 [Candidatus Sumerlaeota bacterium]|nr:hypothetical protein [Candidatus Sumerlaeota bacterium]
MAIWWTTMRGQRLATIFLGAALAAGCARAPKEPAAASPQAALAADAADTPAAVPAGKTRTDDLLATRPVNQAVPRNQWPKLDDFLTVVSGQVPDELKNTLEIRHYEFQRSRFDDKPFVHLEVYNLLEDKPLAFEIRTLFFREDGTLLDTTEWARATARPRSAYRYRASCFSNYGAKEQVQIRLLQAGGAAGG